MSNKQQTLIVCPPLFTTNLNGEHFKYMGFECPTCNGSGVVPIHADYLGFEPDEVDICQRCNGTAQLKADVVIRWTPYGDKKVIR